MKKIFSLVACLFFLSAAHSQYIRIHNSGNVMYANAVASVDSMTFDGTYSKFYIGGSTIPLNIQRAFIDSITFTNTPVALDKIYVLYNGADNATIINPYSAQGITSTISGGSVSISAASGLNNLEYHLLGTAAAGGLTVNSTTPATFILNNVNLTNANGPALIVTGGKTQIFVSPAGKINSLTDGSSSIKNGALETDGKMILAGTGSLTIKGVKKHALSTTSTIEIQSSIITVSSAASDGLHAEGFTMSGGSVTVSASLGDGIDAGDGAIAIGNGTINITSTATDVKGIKTGNGTIIVNSGSINLNVSGNSSKAISAKGAITINGGNVVINLSGAAVLAASGSGFDPSYPSGIKSDGDININSGTISVTASSAATGARGFSADGTINVSGGTITISTAGNGATYTNASGVIDSYAAAAFSADLALNITGGSITTTSSGTGGKGLKCDGTITVGSASGNPTLNITTTGARFLVSGTDYNHPKTIVANGAISIINGNSTLISTDDGIHSDASITISGGNNKITANSPTQGVGEGIEAPIINITGGVTNVTASNDGINATYGTVAGGIESSDHSQLNISGGILIAAGSDAIDSNGDITITGGTTIVCGPTNQPEEGIDYNGNFLMNGGILISAGSNANMTKAMSNTSTQVSMYLRSSTQLAATSLLHIENAAGTEMVTFKPKNAVYYFHFSTPALTQSSQYKVYFGGMYTGGSFVGGSSGWGLYTGGTYAATGATLKSTINTSATAKVNSVTF